MKQLLLISTLLAAIPGAHAFEADLDGTVFEIDTIYHYQIGPGVSRSRLSVHTTGRSVSVYTSTLRRSDGATPGVVEPRVLIGKDQCRTAESLSSMAARHTGGDTQYLTGINGDFFITSSFSAQHEFGNAILGYPNMACAIDGQLAAPDMIDIISRENALIMADDNWYIDATDLRYRLLNNDGSTIVDATAVNYPRRDNEMVVYNSYMGTSTATAANGRELCLRMAEGADWAINKSVKFIVDGSWTQGGDSPIPADGIVISCGPGYANEWIDALSDGDIVKLKITLELPAHENLRPNARHIIGGDVRILCEGEITREAIRWINTPGSKYQRSAVGFSQDRDMMVMAAVDGTGFTYYETAALMKALGCYDALDLDGGGSTAIWSCDAGIYNSPRDGAERAIGNAIYFTLAAPADSEVASIQFADHRVTLPRYGEYTPVIFGYNKYGQLVDTDIHGFTLSAPEGLGSTDGASLMASGEGTHLLKASLGDMEASVVVTVDAAYPADLKYSTILIDDINPVGLELQAKVGNSMLPVAAKAFSWTSSDESVATVDADGVVTGIADGTATITGSCGDIEVNAAITVECPQAVSTPIAAQADGWTVSGTSAKGQVSATSESGVDISYSITSARSPKLTVKNPVQLWSRPDAFSIALTPESGDIESVTLSVVPNGYRAVKVVAEGDITTGADNTLSFDLSPESLGYPGDQSIYPLTIQSLALELGSGVGDYSLQIKDLTAVYNGYKNGVESVAADTPVRLDVAVDGLTISARAASLVLTDLQGRTVARACGSDRAWLSVQAPAPGLYILRSPAAATKIIIR